MTGHGATEITEKFLVSVLFVTPWFVAANVVGL